MKKSLIQHLMLIPLLAGSTQVMASNLADIFQMALEHDPLFKSSEASNQAAHSQVGESRAQLLPQINLNAYTSESDSDSNNTSLISTEPSGKVTSEGYSVNLSQSLYDRKLWRAHDQNKQAASKSDTDLEAAKQQLIIRVAQSYFNVLAAQDGLEFSNAEKKAIARQLDQTKQRFDVGLVAITDVNEAQARYDLAVALHIDAQNTLDTANEALRAITGQYVQNLSPLEPSAPLPSPEPNNIDDWTNIALKNNLEIVAAEYQLKQSELALSAQRARHWPTFSLNASMSHGETDPGFESDNTTVGVNMDMNLFSGGGISSSTSKAKHVLRSAAENLEFKRRETQKIVRSSYLGVVAGISRVKAFKQAVVSSQSRLQASEAGFEVGTRTTVDVLDARQELYAAERDYASARYQFILDTLSLKQASGQLNATDLMQINTWLVQ